MESAREATLALLRRLPQANPASGGAYEASPAALETLSAADRAAAFSPPPAIRIATHIQFDAWALTSIREPIAARPAIAPYLHGEAEWQPPETHVAWRDDRDFDAGVNPDDFIELFPLQPRELLRDTTKRIVDSLEKLTRDKTDLPEAWLINNFESVTRFHLNGFDKDSAQTQLADSILILPVSLGGLENGLFTGKGAASDVSGIERLMSDARDSAADFSLDMTGENDDEPTYRHWFAPSEPQTSRVSREGKGAVSLADHTAAVTANARAIAAKLCLSSDVQVAIASAAEHHDDGKVRVQWQRAIGNRNYPETVLAKSSAGAAAFAETYRHEFGSLAANALASSTADLAAHIVAAHHGRARPHMPADEIFDPERPPSESQAIASAIPQRFAGLQLTYGRWGLAYLESILRAADYAASAGIVANATPSMVAAPSPVVRPTLRSSGTETLSLALDPANPGHYFACCGLFELTSCLYPEATAHFNGNRFIIHAPTTLVELFRAIKNGRISALDRDDATASPLYLAEPFRIRIDWWKNPTPSTSALKTWAGTMEAPRIAQAMQRAIDSSAGDRVLFDLKIAFDVANSTKKVEPFYFDANRGPNADSRDVGFSPNDLRLETLAAPAVEFLCLIGLQRATPRPVGARLFDYHLWTDPISVSLLAAVVNGSLQPEPHPVYRFESWFRTSQRKHKAFLPATLLTTQTPSKGYAP
jgi:CRISPR-associated endonuclease/helicase Cas3